jgi:uncharacterized protein YcnI
MIRPRTAARATLLSLGATLIGVLAAATPAAAHVTVNPRQETQGGYARLAFRVPNESDAASTTKVEVFLPAKSPIASVSTMPVPGWTVAVTRGKPATPLTAHGSEVTEVITKLTWTATPAAVIRAGQFQEFPVSLGPLPEVDSLVFKALQTYSDGTVVRWIDEPVAGGAEPEKPAPVLTLAKAAAEGVEAPKGAPEAIAAGPAANGEDDGDGNGLGVGLGIAGLVAGLAGLVLGGLAFVRTRTQAAPEAPTTA